jgi:hypothetical protein
VYRSTIKVHAGGQAKVNAPYRQRALEDADENQDNVQFDKLMCGAFDWEGSLYVCDGNWIRKITYESVENREKFTAASIVRGKGSFVIAEHVWDHGFRYKQVIRDMKAYRDASGAWRYESRDLKDLGRVLLGSLLVDGADHIVYCGRNVLANINRDEEEDGKLQHKTYNMHDAKLTGFGLRHLTWYAGNIVLCSLTWDGPVLVTFHKAPEQAAAGKREREAGGAEAEPAPAQRPRTAAAPRPASARASMHTLLEELAELSV